MDLTTLGIDLAKSVFQLHGVNSNGETVIKERVTRSKLMERIVRLPKCTIVMEACASANY